MSYFPQLYSNFQFDEFRDIPITVLELARYNYAEGGKSLSLVMFVNVMINTLVS